MGERPASGGKEPCDSPGQGHRDAVYAHTLPPPRDISEWEPLEGHLHEVAEQSAEFAARFGAAEWGRLAGLWHDIGKYAPAFQAYLRESASFDTDDAHRNELRGKVRHAAVGAWHAAQALQMGLPLAYIIAGHHAGLPNWAPDATQCEGETATLAYKLKHALPAEEGEALERAPSWLLERSMPAPPPLKLEKADSRRFAFQLAFFTRMLFSCLVDADFLKTEAFMNAAQARQRTGDDPPSMGELAEQLDTFLGRLTPVAGEPMSGVNQWRQAVQQACLRAAEQPPGLFSLTVPTGGGKTLSSLAFALNHARAHELQRVVVAIPFTSIIEQNADVYRRALGRYQHHVVEHHSNFQPRREDEQTQRQRLAAENWDAPLVVTTNVQLFESLFANRPGRCRKLHRLAGSVIVLDEAQALPPNLLRPTLAALDELVSNYGCTVLLCTATQPALERREGFAIGLDQPHEIIPAAQRQSMFEALKRVEVTRAGPLSQAALVEQLAEQEQALCIVSTRKEAAELFESLADALGETQRVQRCGTEQPRVGTCLHLSANMCPRHRTAVLRLIRRRLERGEPCRVVSTQLVEAGVDVDFPVVYREMAGLDAIAQAAGRCNREGKLNGRGRVVVFEPETGERRLPPFVRQPAGFAAQVMPDHDDPLSPQAQEHYFRLHYWDEGNRTNWDRPPNSGQGAEGVMACFSGGGQCLQFRSAAQRYRLIADAQQAVLIPYGRRGRSLRREMEEGWEEPGRGFERRAQRFVVTLHNHLAERLLNDQVLWLDERTGRLALANDTAYDRRLGLRMDVAGWEPEALMM